MRESNELNGENLRALYQQACTSYLAIDEFRTKLLGALPLATGGGAILLARGADLAAAKPFLRPIGIFGFVITLALFFLEIFGIRKCHSLINLGIDLEKALGCEGQFRKRPPHTLGVINEPLAAAVIYPAVLATWMYLIEWTNSPEAAFAAAAWVFIAGFAFIFLYSLLLRFGVGGKWI